MTFCLGITVRDGLVGIADTRITSGNEVISARKVSVHDAGGPMFVMTSGLRSIRDKVITYFDDALDERRDQPPDRLFKAVNLLAEKLRVVAEEDRAALVQSGLFFDLHAIVGGRLGRDTQHRLYLLYPQGNWVEVGPGTPYTIIGATGYGKPVLDRTLKYDEPLRFALKVGCLAFDSTRISASDVDFPIDVILYEAASGRMITHRMTPEDIAPVSDWWQERLRHSVREIPVEPFDAVLAKLRDPSAETIPTFAGA